MVACAAHYCAVADWCADCIGWKLCNCSIYLHPVLIVPDGKKQTFRNDLSARNSPYCGVHIQWPQILVVGRPGAGGNRRVHSLPGWQDTLGMDEAGARHGLCNEQSNAYPGVCAGSSAHGYIFPQKNYHAVEAVEAKQQRLVFQGKKLYL